MASWYKYTETQPPTCDVACGPSQLGAGRTMNDARLRELLNALASGHHDVEHVARILRDSSFSEVPDSVGSIHARVDLDRGRRCGFPEVIFAQGKTDEQVASIVGRLLEHSDVVLATRVTTSQVAAVRAVAEDVVHHELPRLLVVDRRENPPSSGHVVVASAGTADLPVAEEAAVCAEIMGARVSRLYDVGVAGVHRALAHLDTLRDARALIVVAGMEGALPSLVAGLVDVPVIAVPTSVGYGANLGGFAPLLTMLNSCAGGISVVNIDNGFGAAVVATRVNEIGRAHV